MKHKLVLALLALVVAASGCVNADNSQDAPAPEEDPMLNTSNIDYWNFQKNEIHEDKTLPDTEGYYVEIKGNNIYLPGTDGHHINFPDGVTLSPGDQITVEKYGSDAEFKDGKYTYQLKSQNCYYESHHLREQGKTDVKKCDLSFDFIKENSKWTMTGNAEKTEDGLTATKYSTKKASKTSLQRG